MEEGKPVAVISPNDVQAVSDILTFYERYLLATLAPSAKRSRQVSDVRLLLVKVSRPGTSKIAVLTYTEIEYINSAIRVFIAQVRAKIPKSKNRDAVIESCEQLRAYIVTTFALKKA